MDVLRIKIKLSQHIHMERFLDPHYTIVTRRHRYIRKEVKTYIKLEMPVNAHRQTYMDRQTGRTSEKERSFRCIKQLNRVHYRLRSWL